MKGVFLMYYPYYNNYNYAENRTFLVPFLLGGLGGAAIVGASRPRPVYVNHAYNYNQGYPYPSYGYNYYGGYNYNPYYPYYR